MQTHNMPMPSAVMCSARLLPTSAGLKKKNTTLFKCWHANSPNISIRSSARNKPRAVSRSTFKSGIKAAIKRSKIFTVESLSPQITYSTCSSLHQWVGVLGPIMRGRGCWLEEEGGASGGNLKSWWR